MIRRTPLFLPLLLLGACTQPNSPSAGRFPPAFQTAQIAVPPSVLPPVGQDASGSITFLNRNMALPEGHWKVAATQALSNKSVGVVVAAMALVRVEGGVLRGAVVVLGNSRPTATGFPLSIVCQATDVLWNDIAAATPQGDQDCAVVTFERPALWRNMPQGLLAGLLHQLDLLNVQPPNYLVSVAAHESNRNWSLDEAIYENPDAAGIPPDLSTQRAQSGWAAFRLAADPARAHFVDRLKARAAPLRFALRQQVQAPAPYVPGSGLTPA